MKLFADFEAVKFSEENMIFVTHNGFLYYIYNYENQYWRKHGNAGNDHISVANYPDVSKEELMDAMQGVFPKFIFHSDYDTFALAIGIAEVGCDVNVQVQNIGGNVGEWFSMSQEAITDVLSYLSECCEKYHVR